MTPEQFLVIVEGKNDTRKIRQLLPDTVAIAMTFGIPNAERLEHIRQKAAGRIVFILTDQDAAGRRIRRSLLEMLPDAINIYTKSGYNGVEHTPLEYLEDRFRKVGILSEDTGQYGKGWEHSGAAGNLDDYDPE